MEEDSEVIFKFFEIKSVISILPLLLSISKSFMVFLIFNIFMFAYKDFNFKYFNLVVECNSIVIEFEVPFDF
jgi:hypothetical protein